LRSTGLRTTIIEESVMKSKYETEFERRQRQVSFIYALTTLIILAVGATGLVLLLTQCSGDYVREKGGVITDLHKYCLEFPKDSACQGKDSK
jgi:hypothetical protein